GGWFSGTDVRLCMASKRPGGHGVPGEQANADALITALVEGEWYRRPVGRGTRQDRYGSSGGPGTLADSARPCRFQRPPALPCTVPLRQSRATSAACTRRRRFGPPMSAPRLTGRIWVDINSSDEMPTDKSTSGGRAMTVAGSCGGSRASAGRGGRTSPGGVAMSRRAFSAGVAGTVAMAAMPDGGSATGSTESFADLGATLDRYVADGAVPGLVALVAR